MTDDFDAAFDFPTVDLTLAGAPGAAATAPAVTATDVPDDTKSTALVYAGDVVAGEIDSDSDQDWYKVWVAAGVTYKFEVAGSTDPANTLKDPTLGLRDRLGVLVDFNDNTGKTLDSLINFTPTTSGYMFLDVGGAGSSAGTFDLVITADETRPDLVASQLQISDYTWVDGEEIDVSWWIFNNGVGDADGFRSRLALSTDPTVDLFDRVVTTDLSSPLLRAGQGDREHDQGSFTFDGLGLASGTYWIAAIANDGYGANHIDEIDKTNNVSAAIQITVIGDDHGETIADATTLALNSTDTGEIETEGDTDWFRVSLTAGETYAFRLFADGDDRVEDPVLELRGPSGAILAINDDGHLGGPGSELRHTADFSGTYYLAAGTTADADLGTYTVMALVDPKPDLIVENFKLHSGDVLRSGAGAEVTWDITNVGEVAASNFSSGLFLSDNTTISNADRLLTFDNDPGAIQPGVANPEHDQRFFTIDTVGLPSGTYWLGVIADYEQSLYEGYENNNVSDLIQVTLISDDYYDDDRSTAVLTPGGTVTGELERAGDEDWFALEVKAGGYYEIDMMGVATGDGSLVDPYLEIFDADGTTLRYTDDNSGDGPNSRVSFTASSDGTLWVAAQAANSELGTYEIGVSETLRPDLEFTYWNFYSALRDEALIEVEWIMANYGVGYAGASEVGIYLSLDGVIETSDMLVASLTAPGVAPGDSEYAYHGWFFDGLGIETGDYYVGMIADWDDQVNELGEANNATPAALMYVIGDDHDEGVGTVSAVAVDGAAVEGQVDQGGDADWFAVDLVAGSTYTFEAVPDTSAPDDGGPRAGLENGLLTIRDAAGAALAATDPADGSPHPVMTYVAETTGRHYIEVGAETIHTGHYLLSAASTPLPSPDARNLSFNTYTWAAGFDIAGAWEMHNTGDGALETWKSTLYLSDNDIITEADTALWSTVRTDPLAPGAMTFGYTDAAFDLAAAGIAPGTYWVGLLPDPMGAVPGFDPAAHGSNIRQITVVEDDYAGDETTLGVLPIGDAATGMIEFEGDEDWFAVQLFEGLTYDFSVIGQSGGGGALYDPYLRIYDGSSSPEAEADGGAGGLDAALSFTADRTRVHYVSAGAGPEGGDGGYTVAATVADDHGDDGASATAVLRGDEAYGYIETPGDEDWFTVELRARRGYELESYLSRDSYGPVTLDLLDGFGRPVAGFGPGAPGEQLREGFTVPEDGTYFMRVRGDGAAPAGEYGFEIAHAGDALVEPVFEVFTTSLDTTPVQIDFANSYENPVAVAFVNSVNGAQAVTVRMSNVTADGAIMHLQEPDGLDGGHIAEEVTYMVVEAGTWMLPDGTVLEAGTLDTSRTAENGFTQVGLSGLMGDAPALLSQVMTENGPAYVNTRVSGLTADGFGITMQEEEGGAPGHATETIGWIAFETGAGGASGWTWEAGVLNADHLGGGASYDWIDVPGGAPVLAALQSYTGADPAHARGSAQLPRGFWAFVEEDVSTDAELFHSVEEIGWAAFNRSGVMYATELVDVLEVGTVALNHEFTEITFENQYLDPVLIAFVATAEGRAPVAVRIGGISGESALLRLQEDSTGDGFHAVEEVSYMVVERGTWMLADGTVVQAGLLETDKLTSKGTEAVAYDLAFDDRPAVFAQVQTLNGIDFVTTRIGGSDTDGFDIAMQEEEKLNKSGHAVETVGWVAIETGAGRGDDFLFEAVAGATADSNPDALAVSAFDPGAAHALAQLSSLNGMDPAWARGVGAGGPGPVVRIEEDQTLDKETVHIAEDLDWLAFDQAGTAMGMAFHDPYATM
ncbi:pre-peptidase C-terminal domain-containing protein [Rhodovulum sp. DZ06]|uniref:pre-peptidase C-terminal domain-containing protein n=1 Tax=Rhodovulum sp. DZ06 TaxID=3425126 RepID=UPI003D324AA8